MKYLLTFILISTLSFANSIRKEQKQAEFELAVMYALGTNVKINERKAFNLFHKAARKGHLEAIYLMGVSFDQGRGVKVHKGLARYWFKLAAKKGHAQASFRLAQVQKFLNKNQYKSNKRYALK